MHTLFPFLRMPVLLTQSLHVICTEHGILVFYRCVTNYHKLSDTHLSSHSLTKFSAEGLNLTKIKVSTRTVIPPKVQGPNF